MRQLAQLDGDVVIKREGRAHAHIMMSQLSDVKCHPHRVRRHGLTSPAAEAVGPPREAWRNVTVGARSPREHVGRQVGADSKRIPAMYMARGPLPSPPRGRTRSAHSPGALYSGHRPLAPRIRAPEGAHDRHDARARRAPRRRHDPAAGAGPGNPARGWGAQGGRHRRAAHARHAHEHGGHRLRDHVARQRVAVHVRQGLQPGPAPR